MTEEWGIDYHPELHQWVGPITKELISDTSKKVTFGPAPPGWASDVEALFLIVALVKLSKTADGVRTIRDIALQYLKSCAEIIKTLSQSSSAHVISCAINQYVACTVYQRLGLMSAHDAIQTRAWLDHQTGEAMLTERAGFSLGALTTLVNSTSTSEKGTEESATGLAAAAKILAAGI